MPADGSGATLPAVRELTGWGRTAATSATYCEPVGEADLVAAARAGLRPDAPAAERGLLSRGLGRSYGDSAQNAGGLVLGTSRLDQVVAVDAAAGTVTVQAGVTVGGLMRALQPHGLFVPVTPGTRSVSIGGAIAVDVHGKNHHRDGSIGRHVERMTLLLADGSLRTVAPGEAGDGGTDPALFWGTLGGMGLTGVVVAATLRTLRVESPWMSVDTRRAPDFDALLAALAEADRRQYSVAWVDCTAGGARSGRGVVTSADHARAADLPAGYGWQGGPAADPDPAPRLAMPALVPPGLLNRWTVAAFNEAWYHRAPRSRSDELQRPAAFFHPLDGVARWNRVYGRTGLVQYQCVVPSADTVRHLLEQLRRASAPSFLAVLKKFGPGNPGPLSFPRPGWTLALDLPAGIDGLPGLLNALDETVAQAGGSVYLAKDSRMRPELVPTFYPRISEWHQLRDRVDPDRRWQSDQARRLAL